MPRTSLHLVGREYGIDDVEADLACAEQSDASVLIMGGPGSGTALIGRLIHERSSRAAGPVVTLDCAGLSDGTLESELVAGFCLSAPGTLVLEGTAAMSIKIQNLLFHLLGVALEQTDTRGRPLGVRLISTTDRDLYSAVVAGEFREDLYYRLNAIRVAMVAATLPSEP